jgi:hypothetical protein
MRSPSLNQIADRLNAHVRRFEADDRINLVSIKWLDEWLDVKRSDPRIARTRLEDRGGPRYRGATVRAGRDRIYVTYTDFTKRTVIKRADALKWLTALDAGFIGKHDQVGGTEEEAPFSTDAVRSAALEDLLDSCYPEDDGS